MRRGSLSLLLALSTCGRACDRGDFAEPAAPASTEIAPEAAAPAFARARCAPAAAPVSLQAEVVGDLVVSGDRVYIASIRGGSSAVGVTSAALGAPEWTPLGAALGDAPPPELVGASGGRVYALHWERGDGGGRTLAVTRVAPSTERVFSVREGDVAESMSLDAAFTDAAGLLAWDSAGGVKIALMAPGKPLAPIELPAVGLASGARVIARQAGGYWVIWSERRIDAIADGAPRALAGESLESPGDRRGFEWLMAAQVGSGGELAAAPRRLTPENGHVGAFDVALGPAAGVDVYALDESDNFAMERGGRITRISVDRPPAAPEVLGYGAGRGAPQVASSPGGAQWVFYEDPLGRTRAVPLSAPSRMPSLEPALDSARPSALAPGSPERWLASCSSPPAVLQLRCAIAPDPPAR